MHRRPEFKSIGRLAALLIFLALLGGCAEIPQVHTEVLAFNQWSSAPAQKVFAFRRVTELENSLEMKSYEDLVRVQLLAAGFTEAAPQTPSPLTVTLYPAITSRNAVLHELNDPGPIFSPWGWRGAYPMSVDVPVTVFQRRLRLDIDDVSVVPSKRLFEGTVSSEGQTDSLARIMPYLVRALFKNFPGNNGVAVTIDLPLDKAPS